MGTFIYAAQPGKKILRKEELKKKKVQDTHTQKKTL